VVNLHSFLSEGNTLLDSLSEKKKKCLMQTSLCFFGLFFFKEEGERHITNIINTFTHKHAQYSKVIIVLVVLKQ